MKEFARARRGLGSYAHLLGASSNLEAQIVQSLYSESWCCEAGSVAVKPARFVATDGNRRVLILWGNVTEVKHLIWAWLSFPDGSDCQIVIISTPRHPVRANVKLDMSRIASKIGAEFAYVEL